MNVDVYSSYDEVELYLNEKLICRKPSSINEKYTASFEVPYEAGCLKAVGYSNGQMTTEYILRTAHKPTGIRLVPDRGFLRAEYGDLSFITVEIVDNDGIVYPCSDQNIFFTIKGEGAIEAVGSGNPASDEGYKGKQRMTYRGQCLVVVKSNGKPGEITLRAQADNLQLEAPARTLVFTDVKGIF